jgi:hypothetical protein
MDSHQFDLWMGISEDPKDLVSKLHHYRLFEDKITSGIAEGYLLKSGDCTQNNHCAVLAVL